MHVWIWIAPIFGGSPPLAFLQNVCRPIQYHWISETFTKPSIYTTPLLGENWSSFAWNWFFSKKNNFNIPVSYLFLFWKEAQKTCLVATILTAVNVHLNHFRSPTQLDLVRCGNWPYCDFRTSSPRVLWPKLITVRYRITTCLFRGGLWLIQQRDRLLPRSG